MKSVTEDAGFGRFCKMLKSLKGKVPMHKPDEGFARKILSKLPEQPSVPPKSKHLPAR